jgi:hypothetical protein
MIEKEFNSIEDLLTYFWKALESAEKKEEEAKNNNIKVNYESSQEDLIKRLREQNKKYYSENSSLNKQVEALNKALKEAANVSDRLSEENKMLVLENQKHISERNRLVKENNSLKGGPYNKDFYISVMSNLGKKIVDEYVLWLNLCKALKLEDTEMWDTINDDMYDKIPE